MANGNEKEKITLNLEELEDRLDKKIAGNLTYSIFYVDIHWALTEDIKKLVKKHDQLMGKLDKHINRP